MKRKFRAFLFLVLLVSGLLGCALYPDSVERFRDNEVVLDAWARGKRAEKRGEYPEARESYYFVKRFATTHYLRLRAQRRYETMSRLLEEGVQE
jgi:hypothetical protein